MDKMCNKPDASSTNLTESKINILKSNKAEQHTRIFASMCPDEILDHYNDYDTRAYHTTLMLGDVSGFTDLTEKYTQTGKGGPSKLTEILNSYIGAMVQEILSHNGDVLKFSGDAFIVMWKVQQNTVMRDVATVAMQTACTIQKYFGTFDTDVGVTLKVKLAIASGKTFFTSIGDPDKMSYYIITGKPVWDVKAAEGLCRGGDIIVAPSCWQWANPNEYVYETLPDGIHTLILASSVMWDAAKEKYHRSDAVDVEYEDEINEHQIMASYASFTTDRIPEPEAAPVLMNLTGETLNQYRYKQGDYSLRPKVNKAAKQHLKNALRSYMLRPVVRAVEADEPMEYLTEMRQVVIAFVNVITTNVGKKKLIRLVNTAFILVCGIVSSMQGCVNKTSLFDKDLMFLCIFGLRGDKHDLESQVGLRCAAKVQETLGSLKNIQSVAIGVTTGMTYCGVVGHTLRREYTVIGMSVNKAARLMCVYPDKVVCDRDSFLYSRLEARHFILQEPKLLKGITNVGPIYEFREQSTLQDQDAVMNKFPLLGRDMEIDLFKRLLMEWQTNRTKDEGTSAATKKNTLIIRGEPRVGKTRLLEEIVQHIPNTIPCNRISLLSNDTKSPYTLTQLIFCLFLGFTASSTPKDREDKLLVYLGKIRLSHILCSLNQVFNVNFEKSSYYNSLQDRKKQEVMQELLCMLMASCIKCLWVVIVDDAEYSDDESLSLLPRIINEDLIFFVLAFGQKITTETSLHQDIVKRAHIIDLLGLDKWYHAGLACQILNVRAIPAELEKVIQERSLGNPGWIESYLVSLMQPGGLVIKSLTQKKIRDLGLVVPPIEMMERSTELASAGKSQKDAGTARMDRWEMYQSSYRESGVNLTEKKKRNTTLSDEKEQSMQVCIIAPNFDLEDVDIVMTMEVIILKMFDSLSALDQLLLKCAAVLGETFARKMLESLLEETNRRDISHAVRRLFEMRVLGCAMGDFKRSPGPIYFLRRIRNSNVNMEIRCVCTGIVVDESCANLPKYASCGLMRFKMTLFRDTTYGLLTENQKVEFHEKALKYLQQKTRRCVACGGGHFVKLLGERYDEDQVKEDEKKRETFNYIMDLADYGNTDTRRFEDRGVDSTTDTSKKSCLAMFRPVEKSPTRTFSNVDFANCQCNMILVNVYTQVLDHCRGIGRMDKTLNAILEFVEVCLSACNIPQARKLLNDGEDILSETPHDNVITTTRDLENCSPSSGQLQSHAKVHKMALVKKGGLRHQVRPLVGVSEDELITLPYFSGKIETLQGMCYLESGLIPDATDSLYRAMKTLGYSYPTSPSMAKMKAVLLLANQKLMLTCLRTCKVGIVKGDSADFSDQLANCLAQMFTMFKIRGWHNHARLAAIWGLNAALKSNQDFFALCTAYANMIVTAHYFGDREIIPTLENDAINVCCRKKDAVELQELKAVAELYLRIFISRWQRGETASATSIGFTTLKICQTVHSVTLKLTVLPMLIYLIMIARRHGEVVSMLQELEFTSKDDMDKSARTWYYALCVDLQLESGLNVISFRQCEQYYQEEGDTMITLQDPEAEKRYFTCMWLWCVRNDDWEAAMVWKNKAIVTMENLDEHSVIGSLTAMKKLEGLLIYYVHKMNNRNAKAVAATLQEIHVFFKRLGKSRNTTKVGLARFVLLKSYYHMIRFHTRTSMRLLQESKKIALKQGNKMIYGWAVHCEKAWTGSLSSIQRDIWKEHCTLDNILDWHEVDMNACRVRRVFLHPAGPTTVFFWAPTFKWGLVLAGIGDINRPADRISIQQTASLMCTGAVWSRYSMVIIPKNWNLFSVNTFVFTTAAYNFVRGLRHQMKQSNIQKTPPEK